MPKHILIVNEEEELRDLMQTILHSKGGYEVSQGTYKPAMLPWIEELKPDLVISDVTFGEETPGFELVDKLKLNPATTHIPVILCSGDIAALRKRQTYLAEKNVGVLYKPFEVDELLGAVKQMLHE